MVTIRTQCENCGIVDLEQRDVILHVYNPEEAGDAYYVFECPDCGTYNHKLANDTTRQLLVTGGVKVTVHEVSPELLEPHPGGPLTLDDLIDLHQALEEMDADE